MQTEAAVPRPTRPRSWCNWLRPKRSACSMTMSEALGTSTPTSMTVVLTSTPITPALKRAITAFFSAGGMRECNKPTRMGEPSAAVRPLRAADSSAWVAVALLRSRASLSSIKGQTQ